MILKILGTCTQSGLIHESTSMLVQCMHEGTGLANSTIVAGVKHKHLC